MLRSTARLSPALRQPLWPADCRCSKAATGGVQRQRTAPAPAHPAVNGAVIQQQPTAAPTTLGRIQHDTIIHPNTTRDPVASLPVHLWAGGTVRREGAGAQGHAPCRHPVL